MIEGSVMVEGASGYRWQIVAMVSVVLLVIGGIGLGVWRFVELKRQVALLSAPPAGSVTTQTPDEVAAIIQKIRSHIDVPLAEEPTVAEVTDIERLKDQPFFAKAANGDKVLVYESLGRAILYRPSIDKIIDIAPVAYGTPTPQVAGIAATPTVMPLIEPSATPTPALAGLFAIRNGTTVIGLARSFESQLNAGVPEAIVVEQSNARKQNFTQSLIVDVSGKKESEVTELARMFGLIVSPMPQGESTTSADFLIILGSDRTTSPSTNP